ncbi:hypothetical protein PGT21_030084 [Puccinia graminis f. sp. tritici]|uniref:Uncharacterized protein n=1 Tax=Puccinia graminis f. sp. tritici TaxID=56615 RepID=A0A5B0PZB6_PUCGR|nr:hypothetical protein PGT21_030084 [Puccinia graminis f. sp. tritici]KAA1109216.1 hypothetical protein PGTUg99_018275 [Puccinia graminis f. sp. tritici]
MINSLKSLLCLVLNTLGYIRLTLTIPVDSIAKTSTTLPMGEMTVQTGHDSEPVSEVMSDSSEGCSKADQAEPDVLARWRPIMIKNKEELGCMKRDGEKINKRIKSLKTLARAQPQALNMRDLAHDLEVLYKKLTQARVFELHGGSTEVLSVPRGPKHPKTHPEIPVTAPQPSTLVEALRQELQVVDSSTTTTAVISNTRKPHQDEQNWTGSGIVGSLISKKRNHNGSIKMTEANNADIRLPDVLLCTINHLSSVPMIDRIWWIFSMKFKAYLMKNPSELPHFKLKMLEAWFLLHDYTINYRLMPSELLEKIRSLNVHHVSKSVQCYIAWKVFDTHHLFGFSFGNCLIPTLEFLTTNESVEHFHRAIQGISHEDQRLVVYNSLEAIKKLSRKRFPVIPVHSAQFDQIRLLFFSRNFIKDVELLAMKLNYKQGKVIKEHYLQPLVINSIDMILNPPGRCFTKMRFELLMTYAILKFLNFYYKPMVVEFKPKQIADESLQKKLQFMSDILEIQNNCSNSVDNPEKEWKYSQRILKEIQEEPTMIKWIKNIFYGVSGYKVSQLIPNI